MLVDMIFVKFDIIVGKFDNRIPDKIVKFDIFFVKFDSNLAILSGISFWTFLVFSVGHMAAV